MLSDKEKEALQQIEDNLYQTDQKLAEKLRNPGKAKAQAIVLGTLGVITGLVILTMGVITNFVIVGIVGFIVALTSAVTAWYKSAAQSSVQMSRGKTRRTFLETLQDRWDERKNQDKI